MTRRGHASGTDRVAEEMMREISAVQRDATSKRVKNVTSVPSSRTTVWLLIVWLLPARSAWNMAPTVTVAGLLKPPIASSGFSSQAFAPHFPHTVRTTETKTCSDCHVSAANDNNAIMAQLLLLGTNFVNFVGFNAWLGSEKHIEAVQVTEWEEPQAVIGSYLHRYAYPDWYQNHLKAKARLLLQAMGITDSALQGDPRWS